MTQTDQTLPAPLVSTAWLAARLGDPKLRVIDGSWYLPAMNRDGRAEYLARHIPGAVYFDIDAVADHDTDLPHMLPDAQTFAQALGAMGVADDDAIVVYDGGGLFSAPRVWWMLTLFGARDVRILDGGLPAWLAENRPVESGESKPLPRTFKARLNAAAVASTADVERALADRSAQVVDARSAPRFRGEAPEPRPGLPSGHMAGANNLPSSDLIADGRLKSPEQLRQIIAAAGVDPASPMVTSCGSGVSACIINLALATIGAPAPRVYDGSWTEWASRGKPVATG